LRRHLPLFLPVSLALLTVTAAAQPAYGLDVLYEGLEKPVSVLALEGGGLLLSSLDGRVYLLEDGRVRPQTVLDVTPRVTALQGEQGFYGVALEPEGAARGRPRWLVAAYSERDTGDLIVSAFPYDDEAHVADTTAERDLLRVDVPEPFHYAGHVSFGPDGMLWVSVGNGERSPAYLRVRPYSSQDLSTLRGKLLRLDLSGAAPGEPYAVPPDNPFVGQPGARPEIYAYGFRNPWKFSFHPETGEVLLEDVGEDRWEEVNVVRRGGDHGWPAREGRECLAFPDAPGLVEPRCEELDQVPPLHVYGHLAIDPAGGQAATGGVVVRDPELPELAGRYLFADFVTGRVWALDLETGAAEELLDTDLPITELAEGPHGEVLVAEINGTLSRLVRRP
jgi:glucose/arabinose dehydrogenase